MFNFDDLYGLFKREQIKQFKADLPVYAMRKNSCIRDSLVQSMVKKAEDFKLNIKTLELAVLYVDTYLNTYDIGSNYFELLTISALTLAAKFNQVEFNSIVKLFNQDGVPMYDDPEYEEMEIQLVSMLQYQSNYVTSSDYIEALGLDKGDTVNRLLLFVLIDYELYRYSHFELALAVLNIYCPRQIEVSEGVRAISKLIHSKLLQSLGQQEEESQGETIDNTPTIRKRISKSRQQLKAKQ